MDTLFDCLTQNKFTNADTAIEFCREQCLEYGFNIRKEVTTNRSISICCSRETQVDGFQRKKPIPQCPWQMAVYENEDGIWTFRAPSCEHNHNLTPLEGDPWHPDVKEEIFQLATRQKMQAHEIRETIKLQFPEITWSNRRFYNCLKEEKKNANLQNITDRVQRLILASTRLCSVVAANEDWSSCVENDLSKLLDSYKHQTRLSNQNLNTMVDLPIDKIYSEIEKPKAKKPEEQQHQLNLATSKKRKLVETLKVGDPDSHVVAVPNCTLYIRSQPLRSLSESSSQSRRAFTELVASNRIGGGPVTAPTPFGRMDYASDYNRSQDSLMQSPPIPDNMVVPPHLTTSAGYSNGIYPMPSSPFSPYPPSNMSTSEMSFSFEGSSHSSFQPMATSPNPLMVQRQQQQQGGNNNNNNSGNGNPMNYFSSPLRESNLQQRMMMQEYEQRNLSPQQQDPSNLDVHLPMIRSNVLPHSMLQHQTRINPSEQNTWT